MPGPGRHQTRPRSDRLRAPAVWLIAASSTGVPSIAIPKPASINAAVHWLCCSADSSAIPPPVRSSTAPPPQPTTPGQHAGQRDHEPDDQPPPCREPADG